jgi:hypothetical protein
MGLTSWKGSIVRKADIIVAKNYLSENEIDTLNRLVVIFLESAELRAKDRLDITTQFWKENVDRILECQEKEVLNHNGSISKTEMKEKVKLLYDKFHQRRKIIAAKEADLEDLKELEALKIRIKKNT